MDLSDIEGDTIEGAGFVDKDFERFVRRLLRAERALRHRPDAEIRGPVTTYRGDDQRDLVFIVRRPPTTPRAEFSDALTWDKIGETWYSCKGGHNWHRTILQELGQSAFRKGTAPSNQVKKRPPKKLLEHVSAGARYVFVVASQTVDDRGLLDTVCQQLTFWLEHAGLRVPPLLREQLSLIDANRLADFISTHRPQLSTEQLAALGINEPAGLKSWDQWTDELGAGRGLPRFEADDQRDALFAAIANPQLRVLRVFGPPGVGKTRAVHEGIRRCGSEAQQRSRYSSDFDVARGVVQSDWLRRGGAPWLVLDELRSHDVEQVTAMFRANAGNDARLIMVGTSDAQTRAVQGHGFQVPELGEEQTRRLLRSEVSSLREDQLAAIWHLSEGYPWYAVLLARATAEADEESLMYGDDDATRWYYGQHVLAGPPAAFSNEHQRWAREAELRAKTLLVAILTRDVELEWSELCERYGDQLRYAIDEPTSWHEVVQRESICRGRQLLRQSGLRATRRYVSPNNLARIILHHFLTDPDLGPKIRRYAPEFRATLLEIATSVRVKPALLEQLARGEWQELERRARADGIDAVEAYLRSEGPYEAARVAPESAATSMAKVLTRLDEDTLKSANTLRATARAVFEHVIHRKISPNVFRTVESALLSLALVEHVDPKYQNDASGVWASLSLPGLHLTHQAWELRRELLDARLASADTRVRRLAIQALNHGVEAREMGLGYNDNDEQDGAWPVPSVAELRERKSQLWSRLLRACEDDDHELAAQAQSAAAGRFRGGLGRGLFVNELDRLRDQVPSWTPSLRSKLLESINDVRRYDLDDYAQLPKLLAGLEQLERATAPMDLRERVRAQIGTWSPGPWQLNDPERPARERAADLDLACSLLEDSSSLAWALKWSNGHEAHRRRALWNALGGVDKGGRLREKIIHAVITGELPPVAFGDYLLGWASSSTPEDVERWLFASNTTIDSELAAAALWFLVFQAPSRERLDRIITLIQHGARSPRALALIAARGWTDALAAPELLRLVTTMPDDEALSELTLRLCLTLLERELSPEESRSTLDLLGSTFRRCLEGRVGAGIQRLFTKAGVVLAEMGSLLLVSNSILDALEINADGHSNIHLGHDLLKDLLHRGFGEALWSPLAGSLVERGGIAPWRLADDRLLEHVPISTVLDWIGDNLRRACVVAEMTNPHGEQLDPIARELLIRFGAEGAVPARLKSRALSTPGVVNGLALFEQRQLNNARTWQRDTSVAVRAWAHDLAEHLRRRVEEHLARTELRAKYGA